MDNMNIIIGVVIGVCITKIYINIKNYLEFKRLFKQANELLKIIDEQIEEHEEILKQQEEEKQ
jgi:hypothetical protein